MNKRLGNQTIAFANPPSIIESAAIGSKKESEGPLSADFDQLVPDPLWEEKSWEAAESKFMETAIRKAVQKANMKPDQIDYVIAGDLMNQCTSSAFAVKNLNIPLLGIYGACSTMAESLAISAMMIDGGYAATTVSATSSHFCSAEKQFRTPLEYGGQRTPTAQWTVTGSGAAVVGKKDQPPYITHVTLGRIVDKGITDANNMGAAMAPSFADTLSTHFKETGRQPDYYDLIVSGDLGEVGKALASDLLRDRGYDVSNNYNDCGCLIFDNQNQDTHAGGSGCACSATVLCGHLLKQVRSGKLQNLLFAATGALMSPTTCMQGENILGICYAISISFHS